MTWLALPPGRALTGAALVASPVVAACLLGAPGRPVRRAAGLALLLRRLDDSAVPA